MKYIRNYNEFNEGLLGNLFSKLFKSLLDSFDEDTKKQANNSIAAIEKTKNLKEFPIIIDKVSKGQLAKIDKIDGGIKEISDFVKQDISLVNVLLKTGSEKYGIDKLSPNELYKDSTNGLLKEIFMVNKNFTGSGKDFQYQEEFNKNIDKNIQILMTQIGKKAGIDADEITKVMSEEDQKTQEQEKTQTDQGAQGQEKTQAVQGTQNDKDMEKKITKLKNQVKIIHKSIYDPLIKKIQEISNKGASVTIDDFAKKVTSTKNVQSVKKMITKFAQLDKPSLIKIRDAQGLKKDDTPL